MLAGRQGELGEVGVYSIVRFADSPTGGRWQVGIPNSKLELTIHKVRAVLQNARSIFAADTLRESPK